MRPSSRRSPPKSSTPATSTRSRTRRSGQSGQTASWSVGPDCFARRSWAVHRDSARAICTRGPGRNIRGGRASCGPFTTRSRSIWATVHYRTADIDSGDIILSARAECSRADGVARMPRPSTRARAYVAHAAADRDGGDSRIPDWEKGRLFLYREFTAKVRLELEDKIRRSLLERFLRRLAADPPSIRTVTGP